MAKNPDSQEVGPWTNPWETHTNDASTVGFTIREINKPSSDGQLFTRSLPPDTFQPVAIGRSAQVPRESESKDSQSSRLGVQALGIVAALCVVGVIWIAISEPAKSTTKPRPPSHKHQQPPSLNQPPCQPRPRRSCPDLAGYRFSDGQRSGGVMD